MRPPNPRLQRTRSASPPSPLSRQPLGSTKQPNGESRSGSVNSVLVSLDVVRSARLGSSGDHGSKSRVLRDCPGRQDKLLRSMNLACKSANLNCGTAHFLSSRWWRAA
jgi:hypothetical protein